MGSVEGTILLEVEQLGVFRVPGTWNPVACSGVDGGGADWSDPTWLLTSTSVWALLAISLGVRVSLAC